jgi:2-methylcitrate dehydratase PrpD
MPIPFSTTFGTLPLHAATTLPTALALAEALGSSGKELLTAMILGDDLAARV